MILASHILLYQVSTRSRDDLGHLGPTADRPRIDLGATAMKLQKTPRTHRTRLGPKIGTPIGALGPRLGLWVQGTRTKVLTRWGVK